MQLSTSSAPTDPSLLVALFPGAPSTEQAAPLTTEGSLSFDQLLSATPGASAANGEEAAREASLSLDQSAPFVPALPVICPGIVSVTDATAGDETAFAPGEFHPGAPANSQLSPEELEALAENEDPAVGTTPGQPRRPAARANRAVSFHEKTDAKKPHAKEARDHDE